MKESPILFSAPMVRAILEGRKTQTRRIVTKQNSLRDGSPWHKSTPFDEHYWAAAWIDGGPSPAGNTGPYLKVPFHAEMTTHRVYPKWSVGDRPNEPMTTDQKRTAKNPRLETVGIGSDGWLSSLGSEQLAEHVEGRRLGHASLLPAVDGSLADSAQLAELASGEAELGPRGLNAGRVVHNLASVVKDDGLAVGAGWVVDCDSHGSAACNHGLDARGDEIAVGLVASPVLGSQDALCTAQRELSGAGESIGLLNSREGGITDASCFVGIGAGIGRINCGGDGVHDFHFLVLSRAVLPFDAAKTAHNCADSKRKLRKFAQSFASR